MMEPSFSGDVLDHPGFYRDIAPEYPKYVVLNISELIQIFCKNTAESLFMHNTVEEALTEVLLVISRQQEAIQKITDRQFELLLEHYAGEHYHEITSYAAHWAAFAHSVLQQFESFGLYRNNYLNYQLKQIRSDCIILEKMQYPELNEELYRRYGMLSFSPAVNHLAAHSKWPYPPSERIGKDSIRQAAF